jgi:hypothetical protein
VVHEKKIFKDPNLFLHFCDYLSLLGPWFLHLLLRMIFTGVLLVMEKWIFKKGCRSFVQFWIPLPKDDLCQLWLKLVQWFFSIVWLVSFLEGFPIKWYQDLDLWHMAMKKNNKCLLLGMRSKNIKFDGSSSDCLAWIVYMVFLSNTMTLTFDLWS